MGSKSIVPHPRPSCPVLDDQSHKPKLRAETPIAGPSPVFGENKPSGEPIMMFTSELPDGQLVERSDLRLPKFILLRCL